MSLLDAAAVLKPFGLGFTFLCLNSVQQCNAFYRRPLRASATSLLLGVCVFAQTHYVATGAVRQFILFQIGAACGVAVGIRLGHAGRAKADQNSA
jgi:hypothetical protein